MTFSLEFELFLDNSLESTKNSGEITENKHVFRWQHFSNNVSKS